MDYRGYELYADKELRICIKGHESSSFASVQEAKTKVDRLVAAQRNVERAKTEIPLLVYVPKSWNTAPSISRTILNGVHATQGRYLTKPALDRHDHAELFPDAEWIKTALEQRFALERQIEKLDKLLKPFQIESPGYRFQADDPKCVTDLFDGIKAKIAQAGKTNLDAELKKCESRKQ